MDEIAEILGAADLIALVGRYEGPCLEVKAEGYDLDAASARYELAKDVVAFANAKGGYLIIGISTVRDVDLDADRLDSLEPIAREAFPVQRYTGVINEYVYPSIAGLHVDFVPCEDERGLGVVLVPTQDPDRGPFITMRVVDGGEEIKQIVIGYSERIGSHNEPANGRALQQRLKKGSDTVAQRLSRIEEKLEAALDREQLEPEPDIDREELARRVQRLREEAL